VNWIEVSHDSSIWQGFVTPAINFGLHNSKFVIQLHNRYLSKEDHFLLSLLHKQIIWDWG